MRPSLLSTLERQARPRPALGFAVAGLCLTAETGVGVALARLVPVESLGVLYLVGLLLVASLWGLVPALAMAVASTIVFGYFLLPPAWTLRIFGGEDLAILGIFLALALLACALARVARLLAVEMEAREEADLSAELSRLLLRAPKVIAALPAAARRMQDTLRLPSAAVEHGDVPTDQEHLSLPLRGEGVTATRRVPHDLPRPLVRRLRERVVPSLEVLLEAACERERVADALRASRDELARVAEEQAALRRLATLVAHAAPPTEVFDTVAREMGRILGARHTLVVRYEPVDSAVA